MIWLLLFRRHREQFRAWLRTPARWWERALSVVASAVVFAVVGHIARFFAGPVPLLPIGDLLLALGSWSGAFAAVAAVLAAFFPKLMLCVVYPFSSLLDVEIDAS